MKTYRLVRQVEPHVISHIKTLMKQTAGDSYSHFIRSALAFARRCAEHKALHPDDVFILKKENGRHQNHYFPAQGSFPAQSSPRRDLGGQGKLVEVRLGEEDVRNLEFFRHYLGDSTKTMATAQAASLYEAVLVFSGLGYQPHFRDAAGDIRMDLPHLMQAVEAVTQPEASLAPEQVSGGHSPGDHEKGDVTENAPLGQTASRESSADPPTGTEPVCLVNAVESYLEAAGEVSQSLTVGISGLLSSIRSARAGDKEMVSRMNARLWSIYANSIWLMGQTSSGFQASQRERPVTWLVRSASHLCDSIVHSMKFRYDDDCTFEAWVDVLVSRDEIMPMASHTEEGHPRVGWRNAGGIQVSRNPVFAKLLSENQPHDMRGDQAVISLGRCSGGNSLKESERLGFLVVECTAPEGNGPAPFTIQEEPELLRLLSGYAAQIHSCILWTCRDSKKDWHKTLREAADVYSKGTWQLEHVSRGGETATRPARKQRSIPNAKKTAKGRSRGDVPPSRTPVVTKQIRTPKKANKRNKVTN